MTYQYRAKKPFAILFFLLLGIGVLLTLGRWYSVFRPDFVIISPQIHSHISNLSLSLIAYVGIGYSWLLSGTKFSAVVLLGALLIAGNFLCETLMGFMNTTDIVDAVYGSAGVLVAFTYLFLLHRYGRSERSPGKG